MSAKNEKTLLDVLEDQLHVDIDWMDTDFMRSIPFKFHDMTSNQFIVDAQLSLHKSRPLIVQAANELKGQGKTWLDVYTRAAALLCQQALPLLSGRVFLQTRTAEAYDTDATLAYAQLIDAELARVGIDRSRYGIKIPVTGPAMVAARQLQDTGIETLGTVLMNVEQAVAASQAGCLFVSPYFNELAAHVDRSLWPGVSEAATDHPMAARIRHMLDIFRRLRDAGGSREGADGGRVPRMKLASLLSENEVFAAGGFGCDSVTVPAGLLEALAGKQGTEEERKKVQGYTLGDMGLFAGMDEVDLLREGGVRVKGEAEQVLGVDYLANGGQEMEKAMEKDPEGNRRLKYALAFFNEAEERSKKVVDDVLAEVWG